MLGNLLALHNQEGGREQRHHYARHGHEDAKPSIAANIQEDSSRPCREALQLRLLQQNVQLGKLDVWVRLPRTLYDVGTDVDPDRAPGVLCDYGCAHAVGAANFDGKVLLRQLRSRELPVLVRRATHQHSSTPCASQSGIHGRETGRPYMSVPSVPIEDHLKPAPVLCR